MSHLWQPANALWPDVTNSMESGVADWGYRFRQVELYNHQVGRWSLVGLVERLMLLFFFFESPKNPLWLFHLFIFWWSFSWPGFCSFFSLSMVPGRWLVCKLIAAPSRHGFRSGSALTSRNIQPNSMRLGWNGKEDRLKVGGCYNNI